MRTIKFRGKKPTNGVWVYGSLVYSNEIQAAIYFQTGRGLVKSMEWVYVNPETVGQFTGFLDKNGKEIYEGDVLRSDEYPYSCIGDKERDNYYAVVYYCEEGACFGIVMVKNPNSSVAGISDGILDDVEREKMKNFEVVGNIHEEKWQQYGEYFKTEEEKEADND